MLWSELFKNQVIWYGVYDPELARYMKALSCLRIITNYESELIVAWLW